MRLATNIDSNNSLRMLYRSFLNKNINKEFPKGNVGYMCSFQEFQKFMQLEGFDLNKGVEVMVHPDMVDEKIIDVSTVDYNEMCLISEYIDKCSNNPY